jgi:hypothetical protein
MSDRSKLFLNVYVMTIIVTINEAVHVITPFDDSVQNDNENAWT